VWLWVAFVGVILCLLALDLGVFHRRAHVITLREALALSGVWIGIALVSREWSRTDGRRQSCS
jgi:hypothetical protein